MNKIFEICLFYVSVSHFSSVQFSHSVMSDFCDPLDCKEIQPVHPKGDQSWVFIGRTNVEAETPILWLPGAKNWLIWKTLMLGGIGGKRRKGWQRMRWLDGITDSMDVSQWTPGVGDGQGGLTCCNSWGRRELDTTEQLNWTELNWWSY